ncbi:MAG TPA: hypothetical protein VGQ55_15485 [Pyrinomonadaceae bacterium]|jgi:hypothetical protein|nr:hypothetical protein [Pyrinomonadaceae bacterium]
MKKQLFAIILAAASTITFNASQAYAQATQAIKVDVPFAFNANNATHPAGTYVIKPASDSRIIWRIDGSKSSDFVLARNLSGTKDSGHLRLRFRRYGDRNFLVGFTTDSYDVDISTSRSEKGLRRFSDEMARYEVVTLNTVSQK